MAGQPGALDKAERLALAERRARVARAYCNGIPQFKIADAEGVDPSQITRDLKAIHDQWRASAVRDLDAHKALELARLDNLERTYWECFERSLRVKEKTRTRKVEKKDPSAEAAVEKEQRDGDPRFLDGVRQCIMDRCKLLGLITHKGEISGPGGAPIKAEVSVDDSFCASIDALSVAFLDVARRVVLSGAGGLQTDDLPQPLDTVQGEGRDLPGAGVVPQLRGA